MQIHNVGARQFKLGMRLDYHMSTKTLTTCSILEQLVSFLDLGQTHICADHVI